jgi:hypothetical protein
LAGSIKTVHTAVCSFTFVKKPETWLGQDPERTDARNTRCLLRASGTASQQIATDLLRRYAFSPGLYRTNSVGITGQTTATSHVIARHLCSLRAHLRA